MVWRDRRRRRGAAPIERGWIVHARSTTIQARPESIDAGVAHIRDEVMPVLRETDGYVGLSMLVDRESGRCIVTTAWQDEEAMRASDAKMRPARERAAEMLGGSPEVEEWEIAVLHRDHTSEPGACVRVTRVRHDPQQVDRNMDLYKTMVLPALEQYEGFCSASMLVNRQSGLTVGSVSFDSREAMDHNREQANATRERAMQEMGAEVVDVSEFELALAHLRVPEMA
jgi:quinol monooxygenase YgiN